MVAIVIFLLLLSITLMAVSPLVTKIMQREREEELLFRGKQYAIAILNFQKRQGRFPLELKELMQTQPRSARQLFKEPMCNCDDWGLIHVGQPWPPPAIDPADSATGAADLPAGSPGAFPDAGQRQRPGQPSSPLPSSYTQPPPSGDGGQGQRNRGNGAEEITNAPIIGVYSKVHKKGLRTFKGEEYYDLWGFIAGQNNDDLPSGVLGNPFNLKTPHPPPLKPPIAPPPDPSGN